MIARLGVEIGRHGAERRYYIVSADGGFQSIATSLKEFGVIVETAPSISGRFFNKGVQNNNKESQKEAPSSHESSPDLSKLGANGQIREDIRRNWGVFYEFSNGRLTKDEIWTIRDLLLKSLKEPCKSTNNNFKFHINQCLHKALGMDRGTKYYSEVKKQLK